MTAPRLTFALALLLSVSGCASSKPAALYRVDERPAIEAAARKIIAADRNAALVTVDANGQPRVRTFDSERTRMFFPDFPKDCVLIEVRPQWIEATGHGIEASADTWRPQAIDPRAA